jgi:hypothetical protein
LAAPIYDGRQGTLNLQCNIDNIGRVLPRFGNNKIGVPKGSCVIVGYTVNQYLSADKKESITFNVHFVIVITTPLDFEEEADGTEEAIVVSDED